MPAPACRRPLGELALATAALAPAYLLFAHSYSGDAAIFFTFFKQFFSLPFSFQEGTVSYGASSPLHVVLNAPLHLVAGSHWLAACRLFNYGLIALGCVLLNRAIRGDSLTLSLILVLTALNRPLLVHTAQLFETGLVYAAVALAYALLKRERPAQAILAAGALCLVRPELLLAAVAVDAALWWRGPERLRLAALAALSALPAALYHGYIYLQTGALLPSSLYMRGLEALERPLPWTERLAGSARLLSGPDGQIYLVGAALLAALLLRRRLAAYRWELLLSLPIVALYAAVPPRHYLLRYLLPVTPLVAALAAQEIRSLLESRGRAAEAGAGWVHGLLCGLVLLCLVPIYRGDLPYFRAPRYDYDTLLLRDLAERVNAVAGAGDRLFLYEIQGQYYIRAFCYSPDSLVGNQLLEVVHRRDSYQGFIARHGVKYIVTANAYAYRPVFAGTLLARLYAHDLESGVGEAVEIDGIRLRKVATNPVFADPRAYRWLPMAGLNHGEAVRVYGPWSRLWGGHHPMWNSLYAVQ